MGLMSFIKTAGEKLFGHGQAQAAEQAAKADPSPEKIAAANDAAAQAIADYIGTMNLDSSGVSVEFDAAESAVTVSGQVPDQTTKEKILLCCGNVAGVGQVNDLLTVAEPAEEAEYHTVVSGDSLSKIAKEYYGDANAYMAIFEANKPMLSHPDKIYPGQMLRIPDQA
jgi:nucleoid-associated protein YgaU